mgnify:CR=1 FL=1
MINCLIIEDDQDTVKLIETVGVYFNEISFFAVGENEEEALNLILKHTPNLIFLNFDSVSFRVAESLLKISQCILTTPYFVALSIIKERAYDAYAYDFSDFLMKPLTDLCIRKSLLRFIKKRPIKRYESICIKSYRDYHYLMMVDILFLKADNNTTDFHMVDGRIIGAYKTLKVFEKALPENFLRIHKSYVVNKNSISRIHYGKSICLINNDHKIPFTKTFKPNIDLINLSLYKNTITTMN